MPHSSASGLERLLPNLHATYRPLPFLATMRATAPETQRVRAWWIVLVIVAVPLGMVTEVFAWTGIPLRVGGVELFVSVYLPLLFCLPATLWLGYLWGAIPAYFATFFVALLGGMPWQWALVFSFANPIGLAVYTLAYRSIPIRTDLRSLTSLNFYILVSFVSALMG